MEIFHNMLFVSQWRTGEASANEKVVLKTKGADLVFLPFHDAADRAVQLMGDVSLGAVGNG